MYNSVVEMPRIPSSIASHWKDRLPLPPCDSRLPEAALEFRREMAWTDEESLGRYNVTAWLYRDAQGHQGVQVNPNEPMRNLRKAKGHDPDLPNVGFHSEFLAADWFRKQHGLSVLQIFTERAPCRDCGDFLRAWYRNVPGWYYYVDRNILSGDKSSVRHQVASALKHVYGLT